MNEALGNPATLEALLDKYPDLVNDISTGGAQPLHMCGMSRGKQQATAILIARGADIEALDTYGFTPLHRMASNNLAVGARALLAAGADPAGGAGPGSSRRPGAVRQTPLDVARSSGAADVIKALQVHRRSSALLGMAIGPTCASSAERGDICLRRST